MSSPRRDVSDPPGADADVGVDTDLEVDAGAGFDVDAQADAEAEAGAAMAALALALLNGETDPRSDLPERAQRRVAHTVAALQAARERPR